MVRSWFESDEWSSDVTAPTCVCARSRRWTLGAERGRAENVEKVKKANHFLVLASVRCEKKKDVVKSKTHPLLVQLSTPQEKISPTLES